MSWGTDCLINEVVRRLRMLWSIECQLQPARLWPLFARGETRRDANERYSIGWRTLGVVRTGRGAGGLAWMEEFTFVLLDYSTMLGQTESENRLTRE